MVVRFVSVMLVFGICVLVCRRGEPETVCLGAKVRTSSTQHFVSRTFNGAYSYNERIAALFFHWVVHRSRDVSARWSTTKATRKSVDVKCWAGRQGGCECGRVLIPAVGSPDGPQARDELGRLESIDIGNSSRLSKQRDPPTRVRCVCDAGLKSNAGK